LKTKSERMNKMNLSGRVVKAIAVLLGCTVGYMACAGTITIGASGEGVVGTSGNLVTVSATYDGSAGISAAPFKITFDKSKLTVSEESLELADDVENGVGEGLVLNNDAGTIYVDLADTSAVFEANFTGAIFSFEVTVSDSVDANVDFSFETTGTFSEGLGSADVTFTTSKFEVVFPYEAEDDPAAATVAEDSTGVSFDVLANDEAYNTSTGTKLESVTATLNQVGYDANSDGDLDDDGESGATENGGTVTIADNQVTYVPAADFNGTDSFSYVASRVGEDGETYSDGAEVTVSVTAVNDAPTVSDTAVEGGSISEDILDADNTGWSYAEVTYLVEDIDGTDSKGMAIYGTTGNGTWQYQSTADGTWVALGEVSETSALLLNSDVASRVRYVPDGENGETVALSAYAWDGTSGTGGTTEVVSVRGGTTAFSSAAVTFTLEVNAENDAPTAADNSMLTVNEEDTLTFAASAFGFADVDTGDTLQAVQITALPAAADGELKLDGAAVTVNQEIAVADIEAGKLSFVPVNKTDGYSAAFDFNVSDGTAWSEDSSTMTIAVTASNDAPTAADNSALTVGEDDSLVFVASDFGFADVDSGDTLQKVRITALPAAADAELKLDDAAVTVDQEIAVADIDGLTLVPVNKTAGYTATFAFDVSDGTAWSAASYTMTVAVTAENDAPTAADNSTLTVDEEETLTFAADNFNFADVDSGDTLQNVQITALPTAADGELKLNDVAVTVDQEIAVADLGGLTLTPVNKTAGYSAAFDFKVSDGTLLSTLSYTMTVAVSADNDAPILTGSVTADPDYVAAVNDALPDSFTVTADVAGVVASDVDNEGLIPTYTWYVVKQEGGTEIQLTQGSTAADLTFTYPGDANGQLALYDQLKFTYTTNDSELDSNAVTVLVAVGNEPADIATNDAKTQSIDEGESVVFSVLASDANHTSGDDGIASIVWLKSVNDGDFEQVQDNNISSESGAASDSFTLTTDNDTSTHSQNTVIKIRAQVTDGADVVSYEDFTVTVTDVNSVPEIGTTTVALTGNTTTGLNGGIGTEDTITATVTPGATDADAEDADSLVYTFVWSVNGEVQNQTRAEKVSSLTDTFDAGTAKGSVVTVTVVAVDTDDAETAASVSDSVTIANTAPVAVEDGVALDRSIATSLIEVGEDAAADIAGSELTKNDDDADDDSLTVTGVDVSQTTSGAIVTLLNGTVTYDPNGQFEALDDNETDTDTFVYTVSDGDGGTDTATVTVTINGANDAPVVTGVKAIGQDSNGVPVSLSKAAEVVQIVVDEASLVVADADTSDNDGTDDKLLAVGTVTYNWTLTRDGAEVDTAAASETIAYDVAPAAYTVTGGFVKGDKVTLTVTAYDGTAYSEAVSKTVTIGNPPWFPAIDLTAFDATLDSTDPVGTYRVTISGTTMTIRDAAEATPLDYLNAGSSGLTPGNYMATATKYDSAEGDYVTVGEAQTITVDDYDAAAATLPTTYDFDSDTEGEETNPYLSEGTYSFAFELSSTASYTLNITSPSGTTSAYETVIRPDADGAIQTDLDAVKEGIILKTVGDYTWTVTATNPKGSVVSDKGAFTISAEDAEDDADNELAKVAVSTMLPGPGIAVSDPANPADAGTASGDTVAVEFQWEGVDGAERYYVYMTTIGRVVVVNKTAVSAAQASFTKSLAPGTYVWYVLAENSAGNSGWSGPVYIKVKADQSATIPVVSSVDVTPEVGKVTFEVTWEDVYSGVQAQVFIYNADTGKSGYFTSTADTDGGKTQRVVTDPRFTAANNRCLYQVRGLVNGQQGQFTSFAEYVGAAAEAADALGTAIFSTDAWPNSTTVSSTNATEIEFEAYVSNNNVLTKITIANVDNGAKVSPPATATVAGTTVIIRARGVMGDSVGSWCDWQSYVNSSN
jgi:hypothetical protein